MGWACLAYRVSRSQALLRPASPLSTELAFSLTGDSIAVARPGRVAKTTPGREVKSGLSL